MEALLNLITGLGIFAVLFVIFAESGLLIGFFFPGDSLLFTAGFLAQQGVFHINIVVFGLLLWVAAMLGESTGYVFGRKVGRKLFERKNGRIFRRERLVSAEEFYKKHGSLTIVLACFVPIIRTFVPIVAGVSKMEVRKFVPFNILGTLLWTQSFTYLGYFAGEQLRKMGVNIEVAALIIIFLSISPMLYHALKSKGGIKGLWAATKKELAIVFGSSKKL